LTSDQRKKEKTLKIWVFDLSAKPGKTYKYRMRVIMYNPVAGYKPILKTPEDNLLAGLTSPWSEPVGPVTVERDSYYFVGSIADDGKTANFTVYKWDYGWFYQATFDGVKPGQGIGGKKMIAKAYQKQADGTLREFRKEVDFTTGATLHEISGKTVSIRESDGSVIKQDPATVSSEKDYKKCKDILLKQRQELKNAQIVKESRDNTEEALQ